MNNSFEKLLADWLSSFDGLPKISPELLPKKNGELSIKIRKGPQTVRRYISGVKIVYAEFSLRLRVSHADSKTRLDALKTLENDAFVYDNYYFRFSLLMLLDEVFMRLFRVYSSLVA